MKKLLLATLILASVTGCGGSSGSSQSSTADDDSGGGGGGGGGTPTTVDAYFTVTSGTSSKIRKITKCTYDVASSSITACSGLMSSSGLDSTYDHAGKNDTYIWVTETESTGKSAITFCDPVAITCGSLSTGGGLGWYTAVNEILYGITPVGTALYFAKTDGSAATVEKITATGSIFSPVGAQSTFSTFSTTETGATTSQTADSSKFLFLRPSSTSGKMDIDLCDPTSTCGEGLSSNAATIDGLSTWAQYAVAGSNKLLYIHRSGTLSDFSGASLIVCPVASGGTVTETSCAASDPTGFTPANIVYTGIQAYASTAALVTYKDTSDSSFHIANCTLDGTTGVIGTCTDVTTLPSDLTPSNMVVRDIVY